MKPLKFFFKTTILITALTLLSACGGGEPQKGSTINDNNTPPSDNTPTALSKLKPLPYKKTGQPAPAYSAPKDDSYYQSGTKPSYSRDNNKSIVTDLVTNLIWQDDNDAQFQELEWKNAVAYCSKLTLGGYTDWRLPNIIELHSIVSYFQYNRVNPIFRSSIRDWYWTDTLIAEKNSTADDHKYSRWAVEFIRGSQRASSYSAKHFIRCVK